MTGFILNGLSESLLSSRLFRIKAWVLQVPFLSMIFLYFFDHSNLNHSKVFYWFLYIFYSLAVSLSFSDLSRILHNLIYTMYISRDFHSFILSILHSDTLLLVPFGLSLYKFACLFYASLSIFLYKLVSFLFSLCLFYPKPLSKKTQPLFPFPSSLSGTTFILFVLSVPI